MLPFKAVLRYQLTRGMIFKAISKFAEFSSFGSVWILPYIPFGGTATSLSVTLPSQ